MTQANPQHDAYNEAAIRTAEALTEARASVFRNFAGAEIPRERLFAPHERAGLGVALELERMGNRPVSEGLDARASGFGFELEHLAPTLGTVVHGIDLRRVESPEQIRFVRDVLLERKVVFFREQHLSEDEQVCFGRHFGDLDAFPFGPPGENPFILEIRHGRNHPGRENGWHTDVTWMERPSLGSIAQLIEGPPFGGDTLFSDSHACYLGLPSALQARIEHLRGINDYRNFLQLPGKDRLPEALVAQIKKEIPFGVHHPLLRTHPETGKTALYIHGGFLRHDSLYDARTGETLDPEESVEIVRQLLVQHARPEYQCRFRWAPGSIAFWDNRATWHYAVNDYHGERRLMHRITIEGESLAT